MEFLLIACVALVILLLYFGFIKNDLKKSGKNLQKNQNSTSVVFARCPLCDSPLRQGENLISKVYRPMDVPDQFCTIYGCPHCYPACENHLSRICPVCHKKVPQNGNLTARLFNKTTQKKHVHITGCSECHKKKSD